MQNNNSITALKLSLIVVGMFGFGFALVPLYDLLCEVTGLGGRTGGAYAYDPAVSKIDESRLIKVNFITNTNDGMPWQFWSDKGGVRVHPGELKDAKFYIKNNTDQTMIGQAVASVVPISAADYFHKTECFCFTSQRLEPGEQMELPLRFVVDLKLPKNVQTISLSYALFDVTSFAAVERTSSDPANQKSI